MQEQTEHLQFAQEQLQALNYFVQLTGADAGGTWTNTGLVYTYTVNATLLCTGTDTATVTVTEQAAPNAGTDGTLTVCAGNNPSDSELFAQLTGADAGDLGPTQVSLHLYCKCYFSLYRN
jgi:hypothetical protein